MFNPIEHPSQMEVIINKSESIGLFSIKPQGSFYIITVTNGLGLVLVVPITKSEAEQLLINLNSFISHYANALSAIRTAIAKVNKGTVAIALHKRNGAVAIEFSETFVLEEGGPALFTLPSELALRSAILNAIHGYTHP